jgi:2-haloacid dehalogenase
VHQEPPLQALVFDAYGTLFDVHSVIALCNELYPARGEELSRGWRAKQLEYTWLRSLMGRYQDFWQVTQAALSMACNSLDLKCGAEARQRLMEEYLRLQPYSEVPATLRSLAPRRLAILSNGTPRMLETVVRNAGLAEWISEIISVDEVKIYKPSPRVYQLATQRLGVQKEAVGFVSSNCWDVMGAASFGFRTFWVNRGGHPCDELGFLPDATLATLSEIADHLESTP